MAAIDAARAVIISAGFLAETESPSLLRIKTKTGAAVGSVTLGASATDEQAVAEAKEALNAAAKEPIARKVGRR